MSQLPCVVVAFRAASPPILVFLVYFDFSPQTGSGSSRIGRKDRVAVRWGIIRVHVQRGMSTDDPRKISCLADVSVLTPWGRAKRVNNDTRGWPRCLFSDFTSERGRFDSFSRIFARPKVSGDASCRAFRGTATRKAAVVRSQSKAEFPFLVLRQFY